MLKTPTSSRSKQYVSLAALFVLLLVTGFLNYPQAWNAVASKIPHAPKYWNVPFRLGLDLQGGAHLTYEANLSSIPAASREDAVAGARDVIERRVNAFGVAEPLVETAKSGSTYRLNVELAGIKDVQAAIKQIGETPTLEFKTPKTTPSVDAKAEKTKKDAEILKTAKSVLLRIQKGEDIGKLAAEFSSDVPSKDKGGATGFTDRQSTDYGPLVIELEKLHPWKGMFVNHVIDTSFDYYVSKVLDIRYTKKETEASHILVCYKGATRCDQERTKEEALKIAQDLATKATTANFTLLAKANSDEVGSETSGGKLGFFAPEVMVKPFGEDAAAMRVGQITRTPVETEFGFHVIYKTGERVIPEYSLAVIRFGKTADSFNVGGEWDNTDLSGQDLKTARVEFAPQTNEPQVAVTFTDAGAKKFAALTKAQLGKQIGIFLDGNVISAPVVQSEILGGTAQITGRFTLDEAKTLARRLNAGALPVPITLVSQSTVGPTLGAVDLERSLKAGLIAFLLIALFMIGYYRLPGLVSVIALVFYVTVVLAVFKLLPVTLTLAGIAGFIITVGMAVDANVLIFERMKEELRLGRSLGSAIDEGFKRAWTSIFDSHFTQLIAAFVLFYFTSSTIKGFALTLAIGVLMSLFTAITVTRIILKVVSSWSFAKNEQLYIPKKK